MDLKLLKNIAQGCINCHHGETITVDMAKEIATQIIRDATPLIPHLIDIHSMAYDLVESIENSYHDRKGCLVGREVQLFDINEVHLVESILRKVYEIGQKNARHETGAKDI